VGAYASVFKGRGLAFDEVRMYQPGDDVRFIDWNVTARTNTPHIKVFREEREMTVMLLVDMSGSQDFGTRAMLKRELVAEVSAVLAFSAVKNNDRVGLVLFTDRVEKVVPPRKGARHVMRVVSEIMQFHPAPRPHGEPVGTNLSQALEVLGHLSRRRAVSFVVSDFLGNDYDHALRVAAAEALPVAEAVAVRAALEVAEPGAVEEQVGRFAEEPAGHSEGHPHAVGAPAPAGQKEPAGQLAPSGVAAPGAQKVPAAQGFAVAVALPVLVDVKKDDAVEARDMVNEVEKVLVIVLE
jgi:uncharacterized protein (DUF58 family)